MALLYVAIAQPRTWRGEEVAFIREVASRLRQAVGRAQAEAAQTVLNHEITHRLKNTLAMVLSIAGQTLRCVEDHGAVLTFEKRIHALSAAHDVLLRKDWAGAPAREVVRAALANSGHADRIDVTGDDFNLGPRSTLSLSLLLHELATNAAKYGALSVPEGRVRIEWRRGAADDEAEITFLWEEQGGPVPVPPAVSGEKALDRD